MTYEKIFLKYIEKYSPDIETDRVAKALRVFLNCVKHKEDIFFEMDAEFFAIEKEIPSIVANKFQKMFYKEFKERTKYELKGVYIADDVSREIDFEKDYPFCFKKGSVKAKLEENGKISNDTLFCDLMFLLTGKITETDESILYRSYLIDFNEILNRILTPYLEKVISKYAKGILKYPYDQYEDIKEVVNKAVFEQLCYLTMFRLFGDTGEFVSYVGWEDKTINDILAITKTKFHAI